MSLQLISKINEIQNQSGCVYKALEDILDSCDSPENVSKRTWIGVQLSVCEFLAAGVSFPPLCLDQSRMLDCTRALESKPSWWTTYSGNYRHITVICNEFRPQYETNKLFNAVTNSSVLAEHTNDVLANQFYEFTSKFDRSIVLVSKMASQLVNEMESLEVKIGYISELQEFSLEQTNQKSQELATHFKSCVQYAGDLVEAVSSVEDMSLATYTRFENMQLSMQQMLADQNNSVLYLATTVNSSTAQLATEVDSFSTIITQFKPLAAVLAMISSYIYLAIFLTIVYCLYTIFKPEAHRNQPISTIVEPESTEPDSADLLFF